MDWWKVVYIQNGRVCVEHLQANSASDVIRMINGCVVKIELDDWKEIFGVE